MPMLNSIKRRLVEHLATLVNELHVGSDGTVATSEDGGARTLVRIVPRVQIIDDTSILVEGVLNASHVFASPIQEVYLQYKDATTGEFIPVYRADIHSLTKSADNEVRFSFILEVS
jgi:hypothetical protein